MKTILIIDDEPMIRRGLVRLFFREGMAGLLTIREASNGAEALKMLEDGLVPSLIICDLDMPVMNGAEFMRRRAKTAFATIPLILHSGNPDVFVLADEFGVGAFHKGDPIPELKEQIAAALEKVV